MALVAGFVAFIVLDSALGVVALAAGLVIEIGELVFWSRFLRRYRVQTGAEGLIGERGHVIEACKPQGQVSAHGEIWRATCEGGAEVGDEIKITAVDGLTLAVRRTGRTNGSGTGALP